MSVRHISDDEAFPHELSKAGSKLVVVDFTASWCGPCKRVAPFFADLAQRYAHVLFLKVDVDECPQTANDNKVQAMPTFMFFKNGEKVDTIRGADTEALESKVRELGGDKAKLEAFSGTGQALGGSGGPSQPPPWDRPAPVGAAAGGAAAAGGPNATANGDVGGAAAPVGIHIVPTLMEMGFSKQKCIRAVTITKTTDVQVALDWLFEHSDEPDDLVVTDDDVVMADVYSASRSQTNANVEAAKATEAGAAGGAEGAAGGAEGAAGGADAAEGAGADAGAGAEAGAAGGTDAAMASVQEKEEGEIDAGQEDVDAGQDGAAASLKCDDCGKLFRNAEYAELHAVKTQHSNFSESTEEIKPLTSEEKAAKLKDIEDKMKQRRSEREAQEKEEAVQREKLRRRQGQEIQETKAKHDEMEMKKIAEQRRLDKLEEKAAKQRVLDQIARDKAERAAKFAKKTDAPPPPVTPPVPVVPAGPKKEYDECRLQIRLPDGSALTHAFGVKEELSAVRLYVELNRKDGALRSAPFKLMTNFPKKVFSLTDMTKPLCELGLVPSAVLIVTKS